MDKDILKKAAEILVECRYGANVRKIEGGYKIIPSDYANYDYPYVEANPFLDDLPSRQQLDAIFWYLMKGRDMFYLDGLGHLDAREQVIQFVKEELSND